MKTITNIQPASAVLVGVTGTVGKTTIAELLFQYLSLNNRVLYVGTSGIKNNQRSSYLPSFPCTSPPTAEVLQEIFNMAEEDEIEYIVLETTAESMFNNVYDGVIFDVMACSNFKPNVVRSFADDEQYFQAKNKLFQQGQVKMAIVNEQTTHLITQQNKITYAAEGFVNEEGKLVIPRFNLTTNLYSTVNAENVCCFLKTIEFLNVFDIKKVKKFLGVVKVPGRFEFFQFYGRKIFIDTGYGGVDGLRPFMQQVFSKYSNRRVLLSNYFFDSDNDTAEDMVQKRLERAQLMAQYSDDIIITATMSVKTNKDPSREAPVLQQLKVGAPQASVIYNRIEALEQLLLSSKKGDALLILGTGSEKWGLLKGSPVGDYEMIQIIGKEIFPKEDNE